MSIQLQSRLTRVTQTGSIVLLASPAPCYICEVPPFPCQMAIVYWIYWRPLGTSILLAIHPDCWIAIEDVFKYKYEYTYQCKYKIRHKENCIFSIQVLPFYLHFIQTVPEDYCQSVSSCVRINCLNKRQLFRCSRVNIYDLPSGLS